MALEHSVRAFGLYDTSESPAVVLEPPVVSMEVSEPHILETLPPATKHTELSVASTSVVSVQSEQSVAVMLEPSTTKILDSFATAPVPTTTVVLKSSEPVVTVSVECQMKSVQKSLESTPPEPSKIMLLEPPVAKSARAIRKLLCHQRHLQRCTLSQAHQQQWIFQSRQQLKC